MSERQGRPAPASVFCAACCQPVDTGDFVAIVNGQIMHTYCAATLQRTKPGLVPLELAWALAGMAMAFVLGVVLGIALA